MMLRSSRLCLALAALAPIAASQLQFSYNSAALPAQAVWTDGVEIADIDGDGDNDILFANGSAYGGTGAAGAQPQHLFLNNGAGSFTAAHGQLNVANFNAKLVVADDLDGDGDLDLVYASGSTGSPARMLRNNGAGVFTDVTATNMPNVALRSFSIATGDVDNDGDLDLAVSDGGTFGGIAAQARLYRNNGAGVFTDVTGAQMPVDLYNCQDITFLDYDMDGDVDMALSGKGAAAKRGRLYLNDGAGNFSIDNAMNELGTGNTYETDYADFDGDGDFDSAVQSISGTSEGWGRNDGVGVLQPETTFPAPNGNDDNEMVCMDYNNNGLLDVFVASLATTEKAYRLFPGAVFSNVNSIIQAQSDSSLDMGFGDLDGDGDYDMVTAQGESGNFTNKVYFNAGPADTLAPTLMQSYVPGAISNPTTIVKAQIADAIADDGHIGCTMSFTYTLLPSGGGSANATHMGNGLFRMAIPTPPGTTQVTLNCSATDGVGNTGNYGPIVIGGAGSPWTDLGSALAGVSGNPSLVGTGPLTTGSAGTLSLTNGAPSALSILFISLSSTPAPFKCGTLVPVPILTQLSLFTNGAGAIPLGWAAWPAGLSGASLYFQYGIADGAAVCGVALSNALRANVP